MSPVIALALLVAYLLVFGEVFLATAVRSVFRMSFAGVGPTELRILLAAGAIALLRDPHVALGPITLRLFDLGGLIAIGGLPSRSSYPSCATPGRLRSPSPGSTIGSLTVARKFATVRCQTADTQPAAP